MIPLPITLRQMQHIVVLARRRSYVRAADELQITESALSRSIQTIEQQFSVRLFDRDRSGARPTPNGRDVIAEAETLLYQATEFARKLAAPGDGAVGHVAIGFAPHAASMMLSRVMCDLINNYPKLRTRAEVRHADSLLEMLLKDDIELAVCGDRQVPPDAPVDTVALGEIPVAYLVRRGHPLADYAEIAADDIRRFPAIAGYPGRQFTGAEPGQIQELTASCEDFRTLLAVTLESDAIWLGASIAWFTEDEKKGLVELPPIKGLPPMREGHHEPMRLLVLTAQNRTLSSQARLLLERMRLLDGQRP